MNAFNRFLLAGTSHLAIIALTAGMAFAQTYQGVDGTAGTAGVQGTAGSNGAMPSQESSSVDGASLSDSSGAYGRDGIRHDTSHFLLAQRNLVTAQVATSVRRIKITMASGLCCVHRLSITHNRYGVPEPESDVVQP